MIQDNYNGDDDNDVEYEHKITQLSKRAHLAHLFYFNYDSHTHKKLS